MHGIEIDEMITTAHCDATGWQLEEHTQKTPFETHAFYVHDYRSGHIQLFTTPVTLTVQDLKAGPIHEMSRLLSIAMQSLVEDPKNSRWVNTAAFAAAAYVFQSKSYQQWGLKHRATDRLHAIINIYPSMSGDPITRPAILNNESPTALMDAQVVMSASLEVRRMDLASATFRNNGIL